MNKKQACLYLTNNLHNLYAKLSNISDKQFSDVKTNNQIISKFVYLIGKSDQAKFLRRHSPYTDDVGSIFYIETAFTYLDMGNIDNVSGVGHEAAKQFFHRTPHVNNQLHTLKKNHYQFFQYKYKPHYFKPKYNDATSGEDGGKYTNMQIPQKSIVLKIIRTALSDVKYSNILSIDKNVLEELVKNDRKNCKSARQLINDDQHALHRDSSDLSHVCELLRTWSK